MKQNINIVYTFFKGVKTPKTVLTHLSFDEINTIMQKNQKELRWFVYDIRTKTIQDIYGTDTWYRLIQYRKHIKTAEGHKDFIYYRGIAEGAISKSDMDKLYMFHYTNVARNYTKEELSTPVRDVKKMTKFLMEPFTNLSKIWEHMEKKRNFDTKLNKIDNGETIDLTQLKNKGFSITENRREMAGLHQD